MSRWCLRPSEGGILGINICGPDGAVFSEGLWQPSRRVIYEARGR